MIAGGSLQLHDPKGRSLACELMLHEDLESRESRSHFLKSLLRSQPTRSPSFRLVSDA